MDTITNNSLGWMSKAERAQVRAHPELEWVFNEPRGLNSLRRAVPHAPEETTMLDLVYQRAAIRAAVALPRSAVKWRPWAVTAAAGFLVVLAMLLLPRVIDLTPPSAWAMVDGYILEYDLEFEEEYVASAAAAPEHPLNALIIAVHDWDEQHRDALGGEGAPRASVDIGEVRPQVNGPYKASLRILVPGATEELRDDLTATLAALDDLSEPKVYSQRWYYQEKYPELFYEDHRLIIDGQAYQFPEDFSNDEIETLMMYFYHGAMGGGRMYVAYLEIGKHHRIDVGEVVSIDANDAGDVEIATYADKLEFAPGEQPPDRKSWWVLIPPEEEDLDYDPVELLKRQVSADWRKRNEVNRPPIVPLGRSGAVIVVDLLPSQRWLGLSPERISRAFTAEEKQHAKALSKQISDALSHWASALPSDSLDQQLEWDVKPMESGGMTVQAWIEVWTEVGSDYRSYLSDLQRQISAIAGTTPDSFNTRETMAIGRTVSKTYPPEIRDHYSFYYNLLPAETTDLFDDEIPALWSEEEKREARETAERMEAVFNEWIQQHPELLEEREMDPHWLDMLQRNNLEFNKQYCYLRVFEHAGVLRSVMLYLFKNDPKLAMELEQALALSGVPEPEIDRPGDPRNSPEEQDYFDNRVGYRIEWKMFSSAQTSRCITLGRTPDAFTAEEQTNARAILGAIRDRWREWLNEHPDIAALEYKGRSVHYAQTQHLAGVPSDFWIQLGVEDEDLLADVLAYLDVPGAPEPVVKNIREERETIEKRMQSEVQSYKPEPPVDGYQLIYYLYPQVETMYLTYEEAIASFGEEERERTAELAKELIDRFRMWKYAQNLADDEAQAMVMVIADWPGPYPPDAIENDTAGILVTGIVLRLFVDSEELYEELEKSLAGFPVEPASGSGKAQLAKGFGAGDYVLVR